MANEIINYLEMCQREGMMSLQKGMNFRVSKDHSVILMSIRLNSPYQDRVEDEGNTIIYEGHDVPKTAQNPFPKTVDQIGSLPSGKLNDNGKFNKVAQNCKILGVPPERVRVYEKIMRGIWSYNGVFHLVDSWLEESQGRKVFKFKLVAVEGDEDFSQPVPLSPQFRRIIPTWVKVEVWKRDQGKCVICGTSRDLHFDHIIPWSKGGSSTTPANVQLLCGKHNIQKHTNIE